MHICCEKKRFCLVVLEPHGKKWDVILEIHPHIRNPVFPGLAATEPPPFLAGTLRGVARQRCCWRELDVEKFGGNIIMCCVWRDDEFEIRHRHGPLKNNIGKPTTTPSPSSFGLCSSELLVGCTSHSPHHHLFFTDHQGCGNNGAQVKVSDEGATRTITIIPVDVAAVAIDAYRLRY